MDNVSNCNSPGLIGISSTEGIRSPAVARVGAQAGKFVFVEDVIDQVDYVANGNSAGGVDVPGNGGTGGSRHSQGKGRKRGYPSADVVAGYIFENGDILPGAAVEMQDDQTVLISFHSAVRIEKADVDRISESGSGL